MGGCIIAEPRRQSTAFETVIFAENLEDLSLVPSAIPVDGDELQLPPIHQAIIRRLWAKTLTGQFLMN